MICHWAKNTKNAISKAPAPAKTYTVFHPSMESLKLWLFDIRVWISEEFPGSTIFAFLLMVGAVIAGFVSAYRLTRKVS